MSGPVLYHSLPENPILKAVLAAASDPRLTPEGRAYLCKALHPSDTPYRVDGIPSMEAVPTAALEFVTQQTVSAPASAAWSADILCAPSPLTFANVRTYDGTAVGDTVLYNPRVNPTGTFSPYGASGRTWWQTAMTTWSANTTRYRLMYASVTSTLSASATANEGAVYCSQDPFDYQKMTYPAFAVATPQPYYVRDRYLVPVTQPTEVQMMESKGAVNMEAFRGAYSILKLDEGSMQWRPSAETVTSTGCTVLPPPYMHVVRPAGAGTDMTVLDLYNLSAASTTGWAPHGIPAVYCTPTVSGSGATYSASDSGAAMYMPACSNQIHQRYTGLDPAAKLVVTVRVGFEVVCQPGSAWLGQVTQPVPYDPVALSSVFKVQREMLAAYPSEYNILGALWTGIKAIGSTVLPAVGRLFGGGGGISAPAPPAAAPPAYTTPSIVTNPVAPPPPAPGVSRSITPGYESYYEPPRVRRPRQSQRRSQRRRR